MKYILVCTLQGQLQAGAAQATPKTQLEATHKLFATLWPPPLSNHGPHIGPAGEDHWVHWDNWHLSSSGFSRDYRRTAWSCHCSSTEAGLRIS